MLIVFIKMIRNKSIVFELPTPLSPPPPQTFPRTGIAGGTYPTKGPVGLEQYPYFASHLFWEGCMVNRNSLSVHPTGMLSSLFFFLVNLL